MEIKIHTVGKIIDGDEYKGWYVFIQTYRGSEACLILICDDISFGRDEAGNPIASVEGYDDWMPNMPSVENHFSRPNWKIEWLDWKPTWLDDFAE